MTTCPECKGRVSGSASACPHCGYDRLGYKAAGCCGLIVLSGVALTVLVILAFAIAALAGRIL